jgi:hypothetical protein
MIGNCPVEQHYNWLIECATYGPGQQMSIPFRECDIDAVYELEKRILDNVDVGCTTEIEVNEENVDQNLFTVYL